MDVIRCTDACRVFFNAILHRFSWGEEYAFLSESESLCFRQYDIPFHSLIFIGISGGGLQFSVSRLF